MRIIILFFALLLAGSLQAQITELNGKYGIKEGEEWLIPAEYDYIGKFPQKPLGRGYEEWFLLMKEGQYGLLVDNQWMIQLQYDTIELVSEALLYGDVQLFRTKSADSVGLTAMGQENSKWFLGPCSSIKWVSERFCACADWNGTYELADVFEGAHVDTLFKGGVQSWDLISEQALLFKRGGKWYIWEEDYGFIKPGFDSVRNIQGEKHKYWIQSKRKKGFYDLDADFYLPALFDSIQLFQFDKYDYKLAVQLNQHWGLLSPEGYMLTESRFSNNWVLPPVFDRMTLQKDGIQLGLKDNLMNTSFRQVQWGMDFPLFDTEKDLQERKKAGVVTDPESGIYSWKGKYGFSSSEGFQSGPVWDELQWLPQEQVMLARIGNQYAAMRYPYIGGVMLPLTAAGYELVNTPYPGIKMNYSDGHTFIFGGAEEGHGYLPFPSDSITQLDDQKMVIWQQGLGRLYTNSILDEPFSGLKRRAANATEIHGPEGVGIIAGDLVAPPVYDSVTHYPLDASNPFVFVKQKGEWWLYDGNYKSQTASFYDSLLINWKAYEAFQERRSENPLYNKLKHIGGGYYKSPQDNNTIYRPKRERAIRNYSDWMESIALKHPLKELIVANEKSVFYINEQLDTVVMDYQSYQWITFEKLDYPGQVYGAHLNSWSREFYYFKPDLGTSLQWEVPTGATTLLKRDTLHGNTYWRIQLGNLQGLYHEGRYISPEYQQIELHAYTRKDWKSHAYSYLLQDTSGKWSWSGYYQTYESKEAALKAEKKRVGKGAKWVQ